MTNADFGNYRGFDVRLDKRIGSLFNGTLAYTFSDAKNTGSDPFTYINFGSRIMNRRRRQRPAAVGLPADDLHPAAQPGRLVLRDFPNQLEVRHHRGRHPPERGHVRHLPGRQRHGLHPLPGGDRQRSRALHAGLRQGSSRAT